VSRVAGAVVSPGLPPIDRGDQGQEVSLRGRDALVRAVERRRELTEHMLDVTGSLPAGL
jgi:hypothetical protein